MSNVKELFDSIKAPIALINKNYEFEYVNESFSNFSNLKVNELLGSDVFGTTKDLWPQDFKSKLNACLKGQKQELEVVLPKRKPFLIQLRPHTSEQNDNTVAFLTIDIMEHNSVSKVSDYLEGEIEGHETVYKGEKVRLATLKNVTERIKTQETIRLSEKKFRELYDQSPIAIQYYSENGTLLDINKKTLELFGIKNKKEIKHFSIWDSEHFTKKNIEEIKEGNTITISSTLNFDLIKKHAYFETAKTGLYYIDIQVAPILIQGKTMGYLTYIIDVTEHKKAEQQIKQSAENFLNIFNEIHDAVTIKDLNGVILNVNNTYIQKMGYRRDELIGKTVSEFTPTSTKKYQMQQINDLCKNKHLQIFKSIHQTKEGRKYPVEVHSKIVNYNGKEVILSIARDITDHIEYEKAITESEAKMRAIFENKGTATFIINEKGKIIIANKQCEEIIGYSLDVLENGEGKSWFSFTHPDDIKQVKSYNEARLKGDTSTPKSYEIRIIHKSGQIKHVLLNVEKIPDTTETVISLVDISKRKLAEQKLKNNSNLLRSFIDNLPDDAWTKDLNGCMTMVNRFTKENTLRDYDVIGKTAFEFFPEKVANEFWKSEKQVLINKQKLVTEEQVKTPHGIRSKVMTKFPLFNAEGEITGLGAIAHDITERKEAERKLREQKDFLWLLIDHMPNHIFWKDKNLVYQGCNKTFADVVGLASPKEIKGKTDFDFRRKTNYSGAYQDWDRKILEKGKAVYNIEEPYHTADGTEGIVLTSKMPLFDEQQQVSGILGFCVDISEIKKAENETKRSANFANALLNCLAIPTYYKNIEGQFIGCNKAFENFHGKTVNELIGKTSDEIWKDKWAQVKRKRDKETLKKLKQQSFEFDILDKNGDEKRVIYSESIIYDENNKAAGLIGSFLDITHRMREEKLKTAQLELIEQSLSHNVSEVLESFLDEAEKLTKSSVSFYHLISDDQETVLLQKWSKNTSNNQCKTNIEDRHYPISKAGVWVDCIKQGKPVIHNDYQNLRHKKGTPKGHIPIIRELVVPVIRGGKVKAILGIGNKASDYTNDDIKTIQQLADFAWELIERKNAQKELSESEEKFKSYVENAPFGVFVTDEKGQFVDINPSASAITGYTKDELLNLSVPKLIDEQSSESSTKGFLKMVNDEIPVNADEFYKHKSGEIRQWHVNAVKLSTTRYLGFVNDITEKNEYLKRITESEKRYRNLFNHTPISLWEENISEVLAFLNQLKKQGIAINIAYFETHPEVLQLCISKIRIVNVNKTTLINHKANSKKQFYTKLPDLFTDIAIKALSEWLVGFANGETSFIAESQTVTLQGEIRDTYMKAHLDKQSGIIILAVIDTTDQKKAEQEIKKYQNHLEDLVRQRTEALETSNKEMGAFTYSVSHDLRAPLRAINGFAGYLEKDYVNLLDSEGKRYLNVIRDNSIKMDQLISDLLKLSRTSRTELEFVLLNMKALANSMYMEVASEEERETFEFIIHDLPDVQGDITSIKQLWTNLIGNAVKYSSKSATKRIEIGTTAVSNEEVTYYVKDWGCGFNEEYKGKLFNIFQRLHNDKDFQGSGVGLALVKRIIDRHRGEVWAESKEQKGATFYFSLPIIQHK